MARKRQTNYSKEEIMQILANNFELSLADKENYADRYSHAWRYYMGIEPIDHNNTGVDPIPVIREIVDENFQILQGLFNGSNSSSVVVNSSNLKSTLADAISQELNTVARGIDNLPRKMENWIKETLLTGQGHMKIYLEDKIEDERSFSFTDEKAEDLLATEALFKARGFNEVDTQINHKKDKTIHTTQEERDEAAKIGKVLPESYEVFSGKMVATAHTIIPAVEYIPFQELFIHPLTQYSLDDSPYVCHSYMCSVNEGLMNGWDNDVMQAGVDLNIDEDASFSTTGLIINQQYDPFNTSGSGIALNPNQNYFPVFHHYWRGCYKGTIPKLWHFTTTRHDFLAEPEEVDEMPFVSARVHEIPNSFYGAGIYDTAKYLQDAATREERMLTYSAANMTFGRYWALKDSYDPEALLTPRAGGVVEVDTPQAIGVLASADVSQALNLLMNGTNNRVQQAMKSGGAVGEATEKYGELAGVTMSMMIDKAEQGPKSRAATFAATGVQPLFRKLYRLLQDIKHPIMTELGGFDMSDFPKEIGLTFDVTTTSAKQQAAQNVLSAINTAKEIYGSVPSMFTSENVYKAISDYIAVGTNNTDTSAYITDPATQKPSPEEIKMIAAKMEAEYETVKASGEGAKAQNAKTLSEIEQNQAHAALYIAQMQQVKEQDKQSARKSKLEQDALKLQNMLLAEQVEAQRQTNIEQPTRLLMDAAQMQSQITAEQANILNGNYAQGSEVNV